MDPWDPKMQSGPYTRRRIPRVTIPNPEFVDIETFERHLDNARHFGKEMGHTLFFSRKRVQDPCHFVLTQAERGLLKDRGKRLALAAVVLYQALSEFESIVTSVEEIHWIWIDRHELRQRRRLIRGAMQTMVQNLLMRAWAALPRELRTPLFRAFDEVWRRICRGSVSATFVARAFQGITVTSRCRKKLLRRRSSKKWQVYSPTDQEDRWGKIDLIATGRLAGLGEIGLCIQIKTGEKAHLEVLIQEPSDARGTSPEWEGARDRLWDGMEDFQNRHPELKKGRKKFFPAIVQTGGAIAGVTQIAKNTKNIRTLVKKMLNEFATELKAEKKRRRDLQEINKSGPPLHARKPTMKT